MFFRDLVQVESLAITFLSYMPKAAYFSIFKLSEWLIDILGEDGLFWKGRESFHCCSGWTMSQTLLEVVCIFAGHSPAECGSFTTNILKKHAFSLTYNVWCKSNRLDPCFPRAAFPGTKLPSSGSDLLGQCFSNFIVHTNHMKILTVWGLRSCIS